MLTLRKGRVIAHGTLKEYGCLLNFERFRWIFNQEEHLKDVGL